MNRRTDPGISIAEVLGVSGVNVWVPVPDELAAAGATEERGFAVRVGSRFRIRSAPGIRLTVATLDGEEASIVAGALRNAVSELGPGTRGG